MAYRRSPLIVSEFVTQNNNGLIRLCLPVSFGDCLLIQPFLFEAKLLAWNGRLSNSVGSRLLPNSNLISPCKCGSQPILFADEFGHQASTGLSYLLLVYLKHLEKICEEHPTIHQSFLNLSIVSFVYSAVTAFFFCVYILNRLLLSQSSLLLVVSYTKH